MRAKLAGYNARRLESNEQVYERALNHRSDSYKIDGEKNTWRTHERMCVQSVEKKTGRYKSRDYKVARLVPMKPLKIYNKMNLYV